MVLVINFFLFFFEYSLILDVQLVFSLVYCLFLICVAQYCPSWVLLWQSLVKGCSLIACVYGEKCKCCAIFMLRGIWAKHG